MQKFWVLDNPNDAEGQRRKATWDETGLRYETVTCPVDPMHRGAVLEVFRGAGFNGYDILPATARFKKSSRPVPRFWEFRARGSAGVASLASGYRALKKCPGCGQVTSNTKIENPTKLVDESQWDGSDVFCVQPVSGWILVTDRVVEALCKSPLRGWKAYSLEEMREEFDTAVPERLKSSPSSPPPQSRVF